MQPILETDKLTIAFGGHKPVNEVSLKIMPNTFTSIIGPNGAGKTTLFNLLSGQLKPTSGRVLMKGKEITHLSPAKRTRLGMGRSFQITNVFPSLTVQENVRLAVQAQAGVYYNLFATPKKHAHFEKRAQELLETVLLGQKGDSLAKNLAHGEKRKLEIAMLLALETEVLLLDEPTAGMSLEEVPSILEVIRQIKNQGNRTILLIEHKMDMVLSFSERLMVLFNGKLLAEDTPENIMRSELVQKAYLGGLYDDAS
ncbi:MULTISPECIES: ABC transporter ATP-binding protein [Brevibacillus]|uniref:ABC transporter ATP-binding protein n=1 Tax=Brevibacillus invocatus TaxID=173959 RepID=A0A3M8C9K9_9BACL|nr:MULTISPECIES: ABC transporter ATP-binding protein [Brevibacillus]MCM3081249.1 ABC transporter ATP-binding protein [Brevibacillus invocatus]MCM3431590.1 ABC transporter ATP-binding protein [Brevibacillus invocatus]MDH4616709.1 ABC transporter ATP-binding protein [Brevibacillus sp. AY1]RNB72299.1 ABC transporter ATP-binding protein [Brevibacillus invocatus]